MDDVSRRRSAVRFIQISGLSFVVNLGLTNDTIHIPNLGERSPREVVAMFLPIPVPPERVEAAATLFL